MSLSDDAKGVYPHGSTTTEEAPRRPASARVLRVPCADTGRAALAVDHLRSQSIDVDGTDGRFVLVPSGWSPIFVWDLAEALQPYAHDDELAAWAADVTS